MRESQLWDCTEELCKRLVAAMCDLWAERLYLLSRIDQVDQSELILSDRPQHYDIYLYPSSYPHLGVGGSFNNAPSLSFPVSRGIFITSVRHPDSGWIIALRCDICHTTHYVHNEYAVKPEHGDFWLVSGACIDPRHNVCHSLQRDESMKNCTW
jgi:hypothetical protein